MRVPLPSPQSRCCARIFVAILAHAGIGWAHEKHSAWIRAFARMTTSWINACLRTDDDKGRDDRLSR